MTPEQINIAIHCSLGNRLIKRGSWEGWWREPKRAKYHRDAPNYHGSLDAMHLAEKTLSVDQGWKFRHRLQANSGRHDAEYRTVEAAMCHASAPHRAEAFLRTIGKWKTGA